MMSPAIYLDADACPVKDQVYRVAARYEAPLFVVANSPMRIPQQAGLNARLVVVSDSLDAADDWIAEQIRCDNGEARWRLPASTALRIIELLARRDCP